MTATLSTQEVSFNDQQEEKLKEVFGSFFDLTAKIQSIAKAVQMASIAESHTDLKLDDFELETLMESIIKDSKTIHSECCELSVNPDHLFCDNEKKL